MGLRKTGIRSMAALAAGWTLVGGDVTAQIYRCPDGGGKTIIQQLPCPGGSKMEVRPATGGDNMANAQAAERRAAAAASDREILIAIGRREPAIGMSEANLRMAMGAPIRINRGNYGGKTSDQWVYERSDATWYVYVQDGVVASFQSQQRVTAQSRQSSRRCLNALEIRNMETSANSVTISEEQRRSLRRDIAEARACR